jgi:hypothetical protein
MKRLVHLAVATLLLTAESAAQPPACLPATCTVYTNSFPKYDGPPITCGELTEQLTCSVVGLDCVVTGTVTWNPAGTWTCCTGGNPLWDASGSASCGSFVQNLNTLVKAYFSACSGAQAITAPSDSQACTGQALRPGHHATIMDCNNPCGPLVCNGVTFRASKNWNCDP